MVIPLGLGPACVFVMPSVGVVVVPEGSDLHILGEYLFEGLQLIHVFGFVGEGEGGVVCIVEGGEGRGRFIFISFREYFHRCYLNLES